MELVSYGSRYVKFLLNKDKLGRSEKYQGQSGRLFKLKRRVNWNVKDI